MDNGSLIVFGVTIILTSIISLIVIKYFSPDKAKLREINEDSTNEWEKHKSNTKENEKNTNEDISGGFIFLELPDKSRSMFHDLLKGFEDFARLKGYSVLFSIDNSFKDKIAFKFTLKDEYNISSEDVREDIKDYIEKIQEGNSFNDLPIIISHAEHLLISTTLKNRLNFLSHNYNMEKNTREFYENFYKTITASTIGVTPQIPPIIIQTGKSSKQLSINNSSNILAGDNNMYEDISGVSDYSTITISNSFNKKKEQVDKITEIIKLLKREPNLSQDQRQTIITNFDKIKDELIEEEEPSKPKIFKWLSKTKKFCEALVLGHDTTEAIKWLYKNFNFIIHKI